MYFYGSVSLEFVKHLVEKKKSFVFKALGSESVTLKSIISIYNYFDRNSIFSSPVSG